jgi:hypothetical protein
VGEIGKKARLKGNGEVEGEKGRRRMARWDIVASYQVIDGRQVARM